jgi:dihydrolipoamide dehydrogenase
MQTSAAGIYAVGDAVGGMLLAHKASEEGAVAAENALGLDAKMDYGIIPRCIFTHPEIACVGIPESAAKGEGRELKIGKFPFSALGKARASGETEGMVKIISDAATDEILGIHIVGAGATDLIGEAALAMKLEATAEDIAGTIHPHPTFGEALKEASLAVDGRAIHV